MKINKDILSVREALDKIDAQMRETIFEAEKRLGFGEVNRAFRLIAEAEESLRKLSVLVNPMPKVEIDKIETDLYM
jgi:hypothetical protein